jgi:hypothetical protein
MAQPVSKLLFCKYKLLERRRSFIISGSHDRKLVWVCTACTSYTGCNFNRVPEHKTLPNRLAKAKLPSLYFVGYRSSNDCINKIMT